MNKNKHIINCIIGSVLLALLKSPIFEFAKTALYESQGMGYELNIFTKFIHYSTNIISFAGFILTIVFCIILIIHNITELRTK